MRMVESGSSKNISHRNMACHIVGMIRGGRVQNAKKCKELKVMAIKKVRSLGKLLL